MNKHLTKVTSSLIIVLISVLGLASPAAAQSAKKIAFENASATEISTAQSISLPFNSSGNNVCILVQVNTDNDDASVTYAGIPMARLAHISALPGTGQSTVYILTAAPAGNDSIVVNAPASEGLSAAAVSYSGCASVQPNVLATASAEQTTSFDQSVITSTKKAWTVLLMQANNDTGTTANDGSVLRVINGNAQLIVDSGGPLKNGTVSHLGFSNPDPRNWLGVMVTLTPVN